VFCLNKTTPDSEVSHFLIEVTDQISYQPLRPSIRQELESHIQDRMEDYESQGLSSADAKRQTLRGMGDAVSIGIELNEAHKIQKSPQLMFITALLLLIGFLLSSFMQWSSEVTTKDFLYYIPGLILLVFTVLKGYPLLIRYRKRLVLFIGFLYMIQIGLCVLTFYSHRRYGPVSSTYFSTLLLIPVIAVLLYCSRFNRKKLLAISIGFTSIWMLITYSYSWLLWDTAVFIYLLSTFVTVCFMFHRDIFFGRKKHLYSIALALLLFLGSPLFMTNSGRQNMKAFLFPQTSVRRDLDDTYNAMLIQELLSKTPLTHGLELTPEELTDYRTGAWYFTSPDQQNNRSAETLWEILPQHYLNNYIIAVCIFLFGWIAGLLLIGAIGLFYLLLFSFISRIHGHLASTLAFACGQCLLWQGVFYLLGNFGYQYAVFPNLPLISEGKLSTIFNMLLLGLIFSAYRYDHVIEDPIHYKPTTS
jgi:cell division protein FtsW (lipid II flippase)